MRILWVKMGGLWPLNTGGRQRSFHILQELARRHEVIVLTSDGPGDRPAEMAAHLPTTARVESIPFVAAKPGSLGFTASLARSWASREPVGVWKWHVPALAARARALVARESCDLVVADFLFAVPNVPFGRVPVVHFSHNVEHVIWKRYAALEPRRLRRLLLEMEWRKFRNAEARACRRSALTIAVSEEDRRALGVLAPAANITAVPTGVDLEYFTPAPGRELPRHIAFCGSMDWQPNEDAVCWFADEILPRVRAAIPDATFAIIGRQPTPRVQALADRPGITVTGSVDDVRPHVTSAAISVVPLRIGGGTRLKIFEALAMGQAVLSTTIGAEGLGLTRDREVALADDAAAFSDAAVALLRDPDRRRALGLAGRRLVEARYSWARVGDVFRGHVERLGGSRLGGLEAKADGLEAERSARAPDVRLPASQPQASKPPGSQSSRVVLLCHEGAALDIEGLAAWLATSHQLVGILTIAPSPARVWRVARREWRRSGTIGALDVFAMRVYYHLRCAARDARWTRGEITRLRQKYPAALGGIPTLSVRDPNADAARAFLTDRDPDIVIARCKVLLEPGVFTIPRMGTFVLHPGICPEYRNSHGCFWALARRDLGRVGMTLLRVDAGIDTGPMYLQAGCDVDERRDSHVVVQQRVVTENLDRVSATLESIARGEAAPIPAAGRRSAVWGQPRLSAYLAWRRAARRRTRDASRLASLS